MGKAWLIHNPAAGRFPSGPLLGRAVEVLARERGLAAIELETRIELVENHATFRALGFRKVAEKSHPGYARSTSITMRKLLPGA